MHDDFPTAHETRQRRITAALSRRAMRDATAADERDAAHRTRIVLGVCAGLVALLLAGAYAASFFQATP